jgi:hypothetical protein
MAEQDWMDVPEAQDTNTQAKQTVSTLRSFVLGASNKMEQKIAERPSAVASLIKEPTTLESLKQHPFKTPLKTVSGAWEMLEGIPADIGLALQRGRPQDIGGDIIKTFMGERPAQIGDIYRGAGVPEPLAATGGLALTALKGTPTSALGEVTMNPFVKTAKYLGNIAKESSMPVITKAMKFMAGIPEAHTKYAIENPDLLQYSNLKKLGDKASKMMEDHVVPLEDNPQAKVDMKPVFDKLKEMRMTTKTGELTAMTAKLTDKEHLFIKNVLTELQGYAGSNKPTFARVRYLLGRMDDILSPTYKQRYKGIEPVTDVYQGMVGFLRKAVRGSINQDNFPQADNALQLYAEHATAKNVYKSFTGMNVSFMKSIPIRLAAVAALGIKYPVAGLMALPMTMPVAYKGLIGGVDLGQKIISEPTVTLEMLKKMGLENPKEGEDWKDVN